MEYWRRQFAPIVLWRGLEIRPYLERNTRVEPGKGHNFDSLLHYQDGFIAVGSCGDVKS